MLVGGSLVGGIVGVTYSLWWFTRAYAGEVRLLTAEPPPAPVAPTTSTQSGDCETTGGTTMTGAAAVAVAEPAVHAARWLMVSALDFWGNRRDHPLELTQWEPALGLMSSRKQQQLEKRMFVAVKVQYSTIRRTRAQGSTLLALSLFPSFASLALLLVPISLFPAALRVYLYLSISLSPSSPWFTCANTACLPPVRLHGMYGFMPVLCLCALHGLMSSSPP